MTLKLSGIIDQAYLRSSATKIQAEIKMYSHYFTDHDSVTCVLTDKNNK